MSGHSCHSPIYMADWSNTIIRSSGHLDVIMSKETGDIRYISSFPLKEIPWYLLSISSNLLVSFQPCFWHLLTQSQLKKPGPDVFILSYRQSSILDKSPTTDKLEESNPSALSAKPRIKWWAGKTSDLESESISDSITSDSVCGESKAAMSGASMKGWPQIHWNQSWITNECKRWLLQNYKMINYL